LATVGHGSSVLLKGYIGHFYNGLMNIRWFKIRRWPGYAVKTGLARKVNEIEALAPDRKSDR